MHGFGFEPFGDLAQNLRGDFGQHGIRQNIIHVSGAAFHFGAAAGHFIDQGVVVSQRDPVAFLQAALDLGELEHDDLLHGFVANGEVRE